MNQEDIIEGLKAVCICRGIRKKTFLRLIASGCGTLEALQKATGAGSGTCGGQRCTPRILELLGPAAEEHSVAEDLSVGSETPESETDE